MRPQGCSPREDADEVLRWLALRLMVNHDRPRHLRSVHLIDVHGLYGCARLLDHPMLTASKIREESLHMLPDSLWFRGNDLLVISDADRQPAIGTKHRHGWVGQVVESIGINDAQRPLAQQRPCTDQVGLECDQGNLCLGSHRLFLASGGASRSVIYMSDNGLHLGRTSA